MGKDPAHTWAGDFLPLILTLDSARHAKCFAWLQIKFLDYAMNVRVRGTGPSREGVTARLV